MVNLEPVQATSTFESVYEMETTEQYVPVVLLIKLCKVVLTFGSVGEILECDHSNASY